MAAEDQAMRPLLPTAALAATLTVGLTVGLGQGGPTADAATPVSAVTPVSVTAAKPKAAYVALGDSYSSALGVFPVDLSAPPLCGRSSANYPHRVARELGMSLADATCSGAKVGNMTVSQAPGVAPQFSALSRRAKLVTMGIGVNDHNMFVTIFEGCTVNAVAIRAGLMAPCADRYGKTFGPRLKDTAASLRATLRQVHKKAPRARVVVVGYPKIFPTGDAGAQKCAAAGIPLSARDLGFLDDVERKLNAVLKTQAQRAGATYLNVYARSVGHDMCASPAASWIEPLVPLAGGWRVHPNAAGQAAVARALIGAVRGR